MHARRLGYQVSGSDELVLLIALVLVSIELVILSSLERRMIFNTTWVLSIAPVDGLTFSYGLIHAN